MNRKLRVTGVIIIIVLVVLTASSIAINNFLKYKNQVENNNLNQLYQVEDQVKHSLTTLDKALDLFDKQTTEQMQENSSTINKLYETNKNYKEWDLDTLSEQFGMDIYLIDEHNEIVQSSNNKDIGLNFSDCCPKLMPLFNERRQKSDFISPGIDVEQTSGEVKKFSYEGTQDGKFIIELGYSLENDEVFDTFGFLKDIQAIQEKHSFIKNIRVLNIGGLAIGEAPDKLNPQQRNAFEETLQSGSSTETFDELTDKDVKYRYVYYESDVTDGRISQKIIEIAYDHHQSEQMISKSFKVLLIQISLIIVSTIISAVLIYKWITKHLYMSQHDSLTGLKNRAALDKALSDLTKNNVTNHALMMLDLDNFKRVNDILGHEKGDHVLKLVAQTLKEVVNYHSLPLYRFGGDEFIIILMETSKNDAIQLAEEINKALANTLTEYKQYEELNVSASIGITIYDENNRVDQVELCKQADMALYMAKETGKNCYYVFEP